jgi:hypothetical protein
MRTIWRYIKRLLSRRPPVVGGAPGAGYIFSRPGYCFACQGEHDVRAAELYILLDPRPVNGYTCTGCGSWNCLPTNKVERLLLSELRAAGIVSQGGYDAADAVHPQE